MSIDFDNILQHVIPMEDFRLKWRFTDEKYDKILEIHIDELKPLDSEAAKFLWDYTSNTNLHANTPFTEGFFRIIDKAKILSDNNQEIRKWLYQRGFPFDKRVFLSWQPTEAMIVPWKLLVKYFDSFYYTCSDDLTVIDQSLNWALLFYHEDEIYFGTNKDFTTSDNFEDTHFIW
jgi:hypothetical protein